MTDHSHILLVEDNGDDAFLFERAIQKSTLATSLHRVSDGEEAIHYLTASGDFSDRSKYPLPSLLFLDLKMPKLSGFDLLSWIQKEMSTRAFSTVVLTGSNLQEDVQEAARLGADHYWVKPEEFETLVDLLAQLKTEPLSVISQHFSPRLS